jgi:hypothetical protein
MNVTQDVSNRVESTVNDQALTRSRVIRRRSSGVGHSISIESGPLGLEQRKSCLFSFRKKNKPLEFILPDGETLVLESCPGLPPHSCSYYGMYHLIDRELDCQRSENCHLEGVRVWRISGSYIMVKYCSWSLLNRTSGKLSNPESCELIDKDIYSLKYHMNGSVYELFDELQLLYPSYTAEN